MLLKILASSGQSNKGMSLLEVILALAIFSIIVVSFLNLFTNVNIGIIYSGEKLDATLEAKTLLDKINIALKDSGYKTKDDIKYIIENMLNNDDSYKNEFKIFTTEEEFYNYQKKIHFLISKKDINVDGDIGIQHGHELRILNFYDSGKKMIELSIYIPQGEDYNE